MPVEEHIIRLRDKFSGPLRKAQKGTEKLRNSIQGINRAGRRLTIGATLPIALLGAASIKAASAFEETNAKFQTVFRNISAEAEASAKDLRDNFGLGREAAKNLLAGTGDLLKGFGFSQRAALDLSTDVNKLAIDLASFNNFAGGAEGASAALTKALFGETEAAKSLGIVIKQDLIKAKIAELKLAGELRGATAQQAKALAVLAIAQDQSKDAIGDVGRTMGSFANQLRLAKGRLNDVAIELGNVLLPIATKAISFIAKLATKFAALSPAMKKTIVIVLAVVAAIGPLLLILGQIITIAPAVGAAITFMTGPIGIIIVAIAALVALVTAIIIKWDEWGAALSLILGPLGFIISLIQSFRRNWEDVKSAFTDGGLLAGLKKIGAVLIDALLMPVQQLLELASKIPGLGDLATKGAEKILRLRERLGVRTKQEQKQGKEDEPETFEQQMQRLLGGGITPGGGGVGAGLAEVKAGAPKTFNINIDSLIENLSFNTQNITESVTKTKEEITKALLAAVNDVQVISR